MNIGNWITLAAVIIALGIGVASIIQTQNLQKKERKERILKDIIEWATDAAKNEFEFDVSTIASLTSKQMDTVGIMDWIFSCHVLVARGEYIISVSLHFGKEMQDTVLEVAADIVILINALEGLLEKKITKNEVKDCRKQLNQHITKLIRFSTKMI